MRGPQRPQASPCTREIWGPVGLGEAARIWEGSSRGSQSWPPENPPCPGVHLVPPPIRDLQLFPPPREPQGPARLTPALSPPAQLRLQSTVPATSKLLLHLVLPKPMPTIPVTTTAASSLAPPFPGLTPPSPLWLCCLVEPESWQVSGWPPAEHFGTPGPAAPLGRASPSHGAGTPSCSSQETKATPHTGHEAGCVHGGSPAPSSHGAEIAPRWRCACQVPPRGAFRPR